MIFIKLTNVGSGSKKLYINPMFITGLLKYYDEYTIINAIGGPSSGYNVIETVEEIIQLIEDSGYKSVMDQLGLGGIH